MDERKKIDLQQHVSPKASRKYMVKIIIYCVLLGSLITLIYYVQDQKSTPTETDETVPTNLDTVEVRDVIIEN